MTSRLGLIALLAAAIAAGEARAEPPSADKVKDEKAKKADKSKSKAKPAATNKTKADKPVAGPPDPRTTTVGNRRINLFPERVLQNRSRTERERRTTLGDDGDWKVQAAQVGAMVGIFGALAALCGSGKCMMPGAVSNALPDFLKTEQPVYSNPRQSQPIRSAR